MLPSRLLIWPYLVVICLGLTFISPAPSWAQDYQLIDMWQLKSIKVQVKAPVEEPVVEKVNSQDYTLRKGDTLWGIAKKFNVDVDLLQKVNKITKPEKIQVGTRIVIPIGAGLKAGNQVASRNLPSLDWPLLGTITSGFGRRGQRFHHGLDIAAKAGTQIKAIEAGKVLFAGFRNSVYGNTVIVDHGYLKSIYAHNKKNLVKKGDWVKVGQTIALVGSTGRSTGPHVHLEIHQNDQPVNPLRYLAKR